MMMMNWVRCARALCAILDARRRRRRQPRPRVVITLIYIYILNYLFTHAHHLTIHVPKFECRFESVATATFI